MSEKMMRTALVIVYAGSLVMALTTGVSAQTWDYNAEYSAVTPGTNGDVWRYGWYYDGVWTQFNGVTNHATGPAHSVRLLPSAGTGSPLFPSKA